MEMYKEPTYREPTEALSGALVNPDMILPYQPSRSRSLSPTVRKLLSPSVMSPFFANQSLRSYDSTTTLHQPQKAREPLKDQSGNAVKSPRPSLPGTWQSEESLNSASASWTNHTPSSDLSSTPQQEASIRNEEDAHDITLVDEMEGPLDGEKEPLTSNGMSHSIGKTEGRPLTFIEEDGTDPFSHAAEILANAKRRLTVSCPHNLAGSLTDIG
jgi:hypothetical protein